MLVILILNSIVRSRSLMMPNGFSQCPYCNLWVPDSLVMVHMANHPGYLAQFGGAAASGNVPLQAPIPAQPIQQDSALSASPAPVSMIPFNSPQRPERAILPLHDRQSPTSLHTVSPGFRSCIGKSLEEVLSWISERGEAGCLQDLISLSIVRPLGACGCRNSAPTLRPGSRPSQAKKKPKPIACSRCPRCETRGAVSCERTPFASEKNILSLYVRCAWFAIFLMALLLCRPMGCKKNTAWDCG